MFDKYIWRHVSVERYGFPDIPDEQFYDTMASCARKALPLDLDKASRVLGLPVVKDNEGHQAMLKICKPMGKNFEFNEDPELYRKTIDYGEIDTKSQALLGKTLGPLEPREHDVWLLNQRMNARGLGVDLGFVSDCQAVYDAATGPLLEKWNELTGLKPKSPFVKDYFNDLLEEAGSEHEFPNMQKETVTDALKDWDLPENVRQLVEIRSALTSASVAKLGSMRNCTSPDGKARGLLQYHAATTGRDGGRLIQPTNFPRGTVEFGKDDNGDVVPPYEILVPLIQDRDIEMLSFMLADLEMERGVSEEYAPFLAPVSAVTSALRHCLVPSRGNLFNACDFSTIELRVVLALAGQHDKLELIGRGEDPYCNMASLIFEQEVTKANVEMRQIGKNSVLGLGFQMGAKKFKNTYMKKADLEFVEKTVSIYREEWAPMVPKLWWALQQAALKCVVDRRPTEAHGIRYAIEGAWLTARLPSGRKLYYYQPRRVTREMPWSTEEKPDFREAFTYKSMKMGKWVTVDAYGGLLVENVVQGLARDILYDRALVADANGFPLVLNVYDEMVADVPEAQSDPKGLQEIMEDAKYIPYVRELGIPIDAEPWEGDRYRK
jgi:DNA polymerase bacteriophage-type